MYFFITLTSRKPQLKCIVYYLKCMKLHRKEHVEFGLNAFKRWFFEMWKTKNVPCFAFGGIRGMCYMSFCVRIKPLQLIATNNNYADWRVDEKKIASMQSCIDAKSFFAWYVAKSMKQTFLELEWEILPYPAYSPNFILLDSDLISSNYHLSRSMQHVLTDTHTSPVMKKFKNGWMNESKDRILSSWDCLVDWKDRKM